VRWIQEACGELACSGWSFLVALFNVLRNGAFLVLHFIEIADLVLERGEGIDTMVERTSLLSESSRQFSSAGKRLKHVIWYRNARLQCLIALAIVVVLFILAVLGCGPGLCVG